MAGRFRNGLPMGSLTADNQDTSPRTGKVLTVPVRGDHRSPATLSILASALLLPAGMLVGAVVGLWLKASNPSHVDITSGLAYLGYILIAASITMLGCWAVAIATAVLAIRRRSSNATLAWMVLSVVTVVVIALAVVNGIANHLVEAAQTHT